jgi:hypothetical protein
MPNLDITTRRHLTAEKLVDGKLTAYPCDLAGKPLGPLPPVVTYTDVATGKWWGRVCAVMPSNQDPVSVAAKAAIEALNPVMVDAPGIERGWYVPVQDFGLETETTA